MKHNDAYDIFNFQKRVGRAKTLKPPNVAEIEAAKNLVTGVRETDKGKSGDEGPNILHGSYTKDDDLLPKGGMKMREYSEKAKNAYKQYREKSSSRKVSLIGKSYFLNTLVT